MQEKERRATAITLSLFAHFLVLQGTWDFTRPEVSSALPPLVLEFSTTQQVFDSSEEGLSLHQNLEEPADKAMINQQRMIRQLFLEQIHNEIHKKRLNLDNNDLIGIVWYSFQISIDGMFNTIKMEKTSGNPILDKDAYQAIMASSGTIKRPPLLGKENFSIMIPIKYQYTLY